MGSSTSNSYARLLGWAGLGLIVLGASVVAAWYSFAPRISTPRSMPAANGYEDFVRAGQLLAELPEIEGDLEALTDDSLRDLVASQRPALELARVGLDRECRVPVPGSIADLPALNKQADSIRNVARAFEAAGILAEREGQVDEAIRCYLDAIRLGIKSAHGGMVANSLAGYACESVGVRGLLGIRDGRSSDELLALIRAIEALDRTREPFEAMFARECGWQQMPERTPPPIVGQPLTTQAPQIPKAPNLATTTNAEEACRIQHHRAEASLRLLQADLAVRAFREEHGREPGALSELVPGALAAVPKDPFGEGQILYRTLEVGFRLYSVGPDGDDDGGRPGGEAATETVVDGDFFLEPVSGSLHSS